MAEGFNDFKLKVGSDVEDDIRRCAIMRQTIGWDRKLMVDANQKWGVQQVRQHHLMISNAIFQNGHFPFIFLKVQKGLLRDITVGN